jgi:hypothetical protein
MPQRYDFQPACTFCPLALACISHWPAAQPVRRWTRSSARVHENSTAYENDAQNRPLNLLRLQRRPGCIGNRTDSSLTRWEENLPGRDRLETGADLRHGVPDEAKSVGAASMVEKQ